ncbi:MAG: hypothetical protein IKV21_05995 [Clostridia bacterium]|nr:hypothetical protein [Clostridia bacterium]
MKILLLKLLSVILLLSMTSACAREEFSDLLGFMENFGYGNITVEDFICETDADGQDSYYTLFSENNSSVMLKLIADKENKIGEVRIYLAKYDENASKKNIQTQDINLFIDVTLSSIETFTHCSKDEAEEIADQMRLFDKNTYLSEGELTKTKNHFHYVYHSSSLGSEFIIYNTYITQVQQTEKPESKPMFGDTTNTRTETAPTK